MSNWLCCNKDPKLPNEMENYDKSKNKYCVRKIEIKGNQLIACNILGLVYCWPFRTTHSRKFRRFRKYLA